MTAPSEYCVRSDLYAYGVPPGSFVRPARMCAASTSTEVITLEDHGLDNDFEVRFRAEAGGSLPSPLVASTTYYAIVLSPSTFQVGAAAGGTAINLTTTGTNVLAIVDLPFTACIRWASGIVDDWIPHVVPLTEVPEIVKAVTADLAAWRLLGYVGKSSLTLTEKLTYSQRTIDAWAKGKNIRGPIVPPASNLATYGGSTVETDPRGWTPVGGGLP